MKAQQFIDGLSILCKYDSDLMIEAQHDVIYMSSSTSVSDEDEAKLEQLGFFISEHGCWTVYT